MADLTKTIELLFTATNRTGTAITSVGKDLGSLTGSVQQVAQPFADVTGAVVKLDIVLAGLAAGGMAYAFNESSKLQSSFTELKKVAGDNEEVLNTAKAAAKGLSNTYGESAADILASTANYVQAGFDVEQAMQLTKTGMDLVIAGGVDASQASEILIATLKGFKAPAEDAGRLLDILNEVSNQYATDIEQLGVGMSRLSPIASTMGFSFEETAGILTPVIEVFRSGGEAAVALKTGLLKLIDDSKPVADALASIGVAQRDANGDLRSGKDILYDVGKAFQTLDQNQKLFVTQQLVGIDQSARMVEVFDGLSKSTEITATAMNAAGSAAKEVATRLSDPEVAIKRLIEGFGNLSGAIGDEFQQAGVNAIDGFTAIFNSLQAQVEGGAFDPILDALDDFLNGIGETFETIATTLPEALEGVDYSGFLDSLGDIRNTLGSLFDGLDLGKPEDLTTAIQKVIDTFESLARFSSGLAEVFVTVADKIGDLIGWFNSLDKDTVTTAAQIAGFGAAVSAIAIPIAAVSTAISGIAAAAGVVAASPIIAAVVGIGAAIGGTVAGVELLTNKLQDLLHPDKDDKPSKAMLETEADIKRIYEAAAQAEQATTDYGETSKDSFLDIVNSADDAAKGVEDLKKVTVDLRKNAETPITVTVDTTEAVKNLQTLEYFRESTGKWETITVPVDTTDIAKAKKEIDEIPAVKRFEIETDLKIAEIKAQAETVQSSFEWEAKIDIAGIEAGTSRMKVMADSVSKAFDNTGDTITDLYRELNNADSINERSSIKRAISAEQTRRDEAMKRQKELLDAQLEYTKAKTKAIKDGEALITVNGEGLQPHLEMIMWELFAAIQVRANEEGLDSLMLGGS